MNIISAAYYHYYHHCCSIYANCRTTSFDQVYTVPQQFRYGGVLIVLVHVFGRLEELHTLTFALNCGLLTVSVAHT